MQMDRVEREVVVASDREGVVELVEQDPELGRPVASRVEVAQLGVRGGPDAGVDADAHRGTRRAAAPPIELREQVEVHVDAGVEQRIDIGGRKVRPREADLLHRPAVLERVANLAGRTRVDPDGPQPTHEGEHLRVPLGLQREPESERDAGTLERLDQAGRLLLDPRQVVREDGRPVLTSDRLGVAAGHEQPAVASLEPGSGPPRCVHVGGRC
jgi:hypothetical protein